MQIQGSKHSKSGMSGIQAILLCSRTCLALYEQAMNPLRIFARARSPGSLVHLRSHLQHSIRACREMDDVLCSYGFIRDRICSVSRSVSTTSTFKRGPMMIHEKISLRNECSLQIASSARNRLGSLPLYMVDERHSDSDVVSHDRAFPKP